MTAANSLVTIFVAAALPLTSCVRVTQTQSTEMGMWEAPKAKDDSMSMEEKFCYSKNNPDFYGACKRLGGNGMWLGEKAFLHAVANIEFALRGTTEGGFDAQDVTGLEFRLRHLEGVRVAAYYRKHWEHEHAEEERHEDKTAVLLREDRYAPMASLLRGTSAKGDEWITTGLPDAPKSKGRFYFEFEVHPGYELVQIGVASSKFVTLLNDPARAKKLGEEEKGVGNDNESWAINGASLIRYHGTKGAFRGGRKWGKGAVVVGCAVDFTSKTIQYSTDGVWGKDFAFTHVKDAHGGELELYPAVSMRGRGAFRLLDFTHKVPKGYEPWLGSRENRLADEFLFNTWNQKAAARDIQRTRIPIHGDSSYELGRADVTRLKSDAPAYGVVEEMLGDHVVIRFEGGRGEQEVPASWLVARMQVGRPLVVNHDGEATFARVSAAPRAAGKSVWVILEDNSSIAVPAERMITELSTSKDGGDDGSWQVATSKGVGEVRSYDPAEGSVAVQISDENGNNSTMGFDFSDVASAGIRDMYRMCSYVCKSVLGKLHGGYVAVEDAAQLNVTLPQTGAEWEAARKRHLKSHRHTKRHGNHRRARRHRHRHGARSFVELANANESEAYTLDRIDKARWAIAGYFGAVPDFLAVDTKTFKEENMTDWHQLQEQVVTARQWLLLAFGSVRNLQAGVFDADDTRHISKAEVKADVENMFGSTDDATLTVVSDTLEAAYTTMVNVIFRYEPVQKQIVDWQEDPVYPSLLYHGKKCTEEEYQYGCEGCSPDTYAYVYPAGDRSVDQFGRRIVNLCPLFFSQSMDVNGIASRPRHWQGTRLGTLIHEVSHHFLARTDDVADKACDRDGEEPTACYGLGRTQWLAAKAPDLAVQNADNYLYITEMFAHRQQVIGERGARHVQKSDGRKEEQEDEGDWVTEDEGDWVTEDERDGVKQHLLDEIDRL